MAAQQEGLERDAIGLVEVLFQSITHMAPAVAVALSIGFATSLAAGLTPLAVLLALVAVLFTAYSIGELARHLPSAGGMYTYVGKGIGSYAGWLVAWAFLLAEPIVPPLLYAAFGFYARRAGHRAVRILERLPVGPVCGHLRADRLVPDLPRDLDLDPHRGRPRVIEIGIFLVVSALLVVNAGDRNTASVFIPGDQGIKPALQGMVFCLLAFVGFEAAAPLAEETRDPKRTIRQAVLWSAVLIGLFYVFCYYAATVFFGPDKMADFLASNDGNPWGGMANQVLPGIGSLLVLFAILNSCLANANAGANASTRAIFSLGRSRLIPGAFAALHPTHRTPVNAVHLQGVIGIVIAVGLSLWLGSAYPETPGPLNTYFVLGYALGLLFAGMYIAVNLAVIGYYLRWQRPEFNAIKHVLVPIVGVILMIPAFVSASPGGITIPIIDLEIPSLSAPYSYAPPLVAIWMIVGIVLGLVLRASRPAALATVGVAMGESEGEAAPAAAT